MAVLLTSVSLYRSSLCLRFEILPQLCFSSLASATAGSLEISVMRTSHWGTIESHGFVPSVWGGNVEDSIDVSRSNFGLDSSSRPPILTTDDHLLGTVDASPPLCRLGVSPPTPPLSKLQLATLLTSFVSSKSLIFSRVD